MHSQLLHLLELFVAPVKWGSTNSKDEFVHVQWILLQQHGLHTSLKQSIHPQNMCPCNQCTNLGLTKRFCKTHFGVKNLQNKILRDFSSLHHSPKKRPAIFIQHATKSWQWFYPKINHYPILMTQNPVNYHPGITANVNHLNNLPDVYNCRLITDCPIEKWLWRSDPNCK